MSYVKPFSNYDAIKSKLFVFLKGSVASFFQNDKERDLDWEKMQALNMEELIMEQIIKPLVPKRDLTKEEIEKYKEGKVETKETSKGQIYPVQWRHRRR